MKLIIVGCGRIGSELALALTAEGHQVTILDHSDETFERLGTSFSGRMITGNLLDREVLLRAGIEAADGLAAVTPDDATNFVVARAAKEIFQVPNVVARAYDPLRREAFEKLGIRVVTSSSWAAQRITQLLTHPGITPLLTLGHGEILVVEVHIKANLDGQSVATLHADSQVIPIALLREGKGMLATSEIRLQKDDLLILGTLAGHLEVFKTLIDGIKEA